MGFIKAAQLFLKELESSGSKACFISVEQLKQAETLYNDLIEKKLIAPNMYKRYLDNYYDFKAVYENKSVKSICITATPSPISIVRFEYNNLSIDVEIPPIYTDRRDILEKIKKASEVFLKFGYSTYPVCLPKKPLSVHGGLAEYGRNNLVYVEGMGSFHRLTAFATDALIDSYQWRGLKRMETCDSCKACLNNCPTGAIRYENPIIDADRCLTFHNEQSAQFPEWIEATWHHALVGCLRCQDACPNNRAQKNNRKFIGTFDSTETELIITQKPFSDLPEILQEKLKKFSMDIYYHTLSKNLQVLRRK
ncbi:MAG: 4Fe-4S double cluster binding domain-containing protein [Bacillota bacterium]|nr:4Fe-4S double cluster binding domain-containing protein [Bacillota bacterium]